MTCGPACLTDLVACHGCGEMVPAGEGHRDLDHPWFGYWMCYCGHCSRHHTRWLHTDTDSFARCDSCDCLNPYPPDNDDAPF